MASTVSRSLGGTLSGARGTVQGRNAGSAPFALESNHVRMQNGTGAYDKKIVLRYDRSLDQQSGVAGSVTLGQLGPWPTDVVLKCGGYDGRVIGYGVTHTTNAVTLSLQLRNPGATLSLVSTGDLGAGAAAATVSQTMTAASTGVFVAAGQTCSAVLIKIGASNAMSAGRADFWIDVVSAGDGVPLNIGSTLASLT